MSSLFRSPSPPTFCGKLEEDPVEWLESFEKIARDNQWSDDDMRLDFDLYLDGAAGKWYSQLENTKALPETWKDVSKEGISSRENIGLRNLFLNRFKSPYYERVHLFKLCRRFQGRNECIFDYCYDVIKLCRLVDKDMTEKRKLDHLFFGLKPNLLEKMWFLDVKCCDDFLREAERFQDIEFRNSCQQDAVMAEPSPARNLSLVRPTENNQLMKVIKQIESIEKLVNELKFDVVVLAKSGGK